MQFALLYLAIVPIFALIDLLWIGVVANRFYTSQIGHLLGPVYWPAAITFYFVYTAGIIFFAVYPGITAASLPKTALLGAALGCFAYATYDLTNWATLKNWTLSMTVVDVLWGTIFTSAISALAFYVAKWLL